MKTPPKERTQAARLSGFAQQVRYPVGTADFLYKRVFAEGLLSEEEYALRLLVSSDECRQLAKHLNMLAAQIEAMGGTKQ